MPTLQNSASSLKNHFQKCHLDTLEIRNESASGSSSDIQILKSTTVNDTSPAATTTEQLIEILPTDNQIPRSIQPETTSTDCDDNVQSFKENQVPCLSTNNAVILSDERSDDMVASDQTLSKHVQNLTLVGKSKLVRVHKAKITPITSKKRVCDKGLPAKRPRK